MRLAGIGRRGCVDGPAEGAYLNGPHSVCRLPEPGSGDADGAWVVSDTDNNRLRLLRGGKVSTMASEDVWLNPKGMCVADAGRSLLVCDSGHNKIRLVKLQGRKRRAEVLTLAGSGRRGLSDGPAVKASFNNPSGICVAPDGSVLVANTGNNCIRRIAARPDHGDALFVTTVAGSRAVGHEDGVGAAARFASPDGIACTENGNVVVADTDNHCIRWVSVDSRQQWTVSTVLGMPCVAGAVDGRVGEARLCRPTGVAMVFGGLAVADTGNGRLVFARESEGGAGEGPLEGARTIQGVDGSLLYRPSGLAPSADGDSIVVSDAGSHLLLAVAVKTAPLSPAARLPPSPSNASRPRRGRPVSPPAPGPPVAAPVAAPASAPVLEVDDVDSVIEPRKAVTSDDRIDALLRRSIVERHQPQSRRRPGPSASAAVQKHHPSFAAPRRVKTAPPPAPPAPPAAPALSLDAVVLERLDFLENENEGLRAENGELQLLLRAATERIEALLHVVEGRLQRPL